MYRTCSNLSRTAVAMPALVTGNQYASPTMRRFLRRGLGVVGSHAIAAEERLEAESGRRGVAQIE